MNRNARQSAKPAEPERLVVYEGPDLRIVVYPDEVLIDVLHEHFWVTTRLDRIGEPNVPDVAVVDEANRWEALQMALGSAATAEAAPKGPTADKGQDEGTEE